MRIGLRGLLVAAVLAGAPPAAAGDWLYAPEGNRLRRIDLTSVGAGPVRQEIAIERAALDPARGRDINGMVCALPDGSGRFVAGEDTGQPHPPAGWGVFAPDGRQVGRLVTSSAARKPDPYGCAFDARGRLFTTEIGDPGFAPGADGQLVVWFPPWDRFPDPSDVDALSPNACKIATDIGTATGVAIDREGRVYVASASGLRIHRFLPPFPASVEECSARDETGAPMAPAVRRETFAWARPLDGLVTYSGLAIAPGGNLYAASVATGRIAEFDPTGRFVRLVLDAQGWLPPFATGTPQGLAVGPDGTLYYADLALVWTGASLRPGPEGKVWRIRFDEAGAPQPPELVLGGLEYPDGLGLLAGAPDPH
jgi:DNA-binding beta-propeller fold protein YncE